MTFDRVFDTQAVFRLVLDAVARPGTVIDLAPFAARVAPPMAMNGAAAVVALTLLDAEATFAVWAPPPADVERARALRSRTNARSSGPAAAAFHFVLGVDPSAALDAASVGTLENPHLGATLLLEVDLLAAATEAAPAAGARRFALRGPGIADTTTIDVAATFDWWSPRAARVAEFPMGVDLLLVDRSDRLAALPRTTRIELDPGAAGPG